ncbi:MAG: Sec-independent protein translocase subunit TatB [Propionibacteriaceae bacterium]|nr:Sec-independent protein translocase subunit TatB [Propionibacteriaceae bacterium]
MFDVGPAEIALLAVLAVIIFGPERLPELARKAARIVRFLRGIANNAQESLSRELGTEVDLSNPKGFIKSYLLQDIQPVLDDVKKDLQEVEKEVREEFAHVKGNIEALDSARQGDVAYAGAPFDPEAT